MKVIVDHRGYDMPIKQDGKAVVIRDQLSLDQHGWTTIITLTPDEIRALYNNLPK